MNSAVDQSQDAATIKQQRRGKNVFYQFIRFVVLNLRIFSLTKHKH